VSKSTRPRTRAQTSRAAIKAYEARRAEEVHRADAMAETADGSPQLRSARTSMSMTRMQEFTYIRSDLRRLLMILAVLTVLLIVATVILR
jgi:hypothetical protein